ncbi:MAG: AmmeMemoRadiSam system protein B [Bifidobacteriaceae bacterium]|jgi:AmmeMemoRadiSam system protein B|nr:AmmeMemoRadiSam system protein B [Bifidobacteriaceae bacterium]
MAVTRQPAVAGLFYPASPEELSAQVLSLLDQAAAAQARPAGPVKALIAPHAGYRYSGATAAAGYAAAAGAGYERVVLLGPCHQVGTPFVALAGADCFRTPLGDVPVWQEGAAIAAALPQVITSPPVHAREHSLEVHLPFIQAALGPGVPVLPLAVGWAEPAAVAAVIEAVWGGPETLVVVSSDLSHYLPYQQAVAVDSEAIGQILAGRPPLRSDQACGVFPVNGLLEVSRRLGLSARLVQYANSGDTAGDRSAVVGYAAIAFTQEGAR